MQSSDGKAESNLTLNLIDSFSSLANRPSLVAHHYQLLLLLSFRLWHK